MTKFKTCLALLAGATMLTAPTFVAAQDVNADIGADITAMCGDKPVTVALTDGFGGNTWRRISEAEFRDEAAKCPNIEEVIYMDAGADQQKYNSDINSLAAQGVDIIVTFTDFGEASIPAYRAAMQAGVTVVPYFGLLKGEAGRDFSANVYIDQVASGKAWADWYGQNLKEGNLIFLGGFAGAASSTGFLNGFKAGLAQYPGLKLLQDDFVVTNWSAADAQKAVAGVIAQYPQVDGIITDYGVSAVGAVRAYQQAGLPVPAIATTASSNELNCMYVQDKEAGKAWNYFSIDGLNRLARYGLRKGLSIAQGTPNDESDAVAFPAYADSFAGLDPKCDPAAPVDADLSSALSKEALYAVFNQ